MTQQPVRQIASLTLEAATRLADAAVRSARSMERRVCVVVLDGAGRFIAGQCMDDAPGAAFQVALGKARHSAEFRRRTSFQERLLTESNALQILAVPGMLPLAGGVPLEADGALVGAIGVSGAAANEDEALADTAIGAVPGLNSGGR